jgi:hypothetical protein
MANAILFGRYYRLATIQRGVSDRFGPKFFRASRRRAQVFHFFRLRTHDSKAVSRPPMVSAKLDKIELPVI